MSDNTTRVCTLDTCPASEGMVGYQPNLAGNALFTALFGIMLFVQFGSGIRYKTWTYLVAMGFGLVLEVVGYSGRLLLHKNPFNFDYFIQYLVCLTIGPAFLTAGIYITFTRIVHSCDERLSLIQPRKVSFVFMTFDFLCLVLQATGGAITATSDGWSERAVTLRQRGVDVMIGGLAFHVVSLFLFMSYAAFYTWRYRAASAKRGGSSGHRGLRWKALSIGLTLASVTIFTRCVYRVAELREGFSSDLAHDEVAFMILEGAMIVIASACLTVCHPGLCLNIAWKIQRKSPGTSIEEAQYVDLGNVHTTAK